MSWNMFDTFHTRDDFAVGFTVADTLTINQMSSLCWHASPSQVVHPPSYVSLHEMYATQLSTLQLFVRSKLEIKTGIKEMLFLCHFADFFCAQWQDDHCERTFLGHLVMLLAFFSSHIEISSVFRLTLILKYGGYISVQMKMLSLMSFTWMVGHWFTTVNSFVNVRVGQEAVCCIWITWCSTESC